MCNLHQPFRPACAQYIDFLADTLSGSDYAALLPPLPDLVQGFGVDPEVAFKVRAPGRDMFRCHKTLSGQAVF